MEALRNNRRTGWRKETSCKFQCNFLWIDLYLFIYLCVSTLDCTLLPTHLFVWIHTGKKYNNSATIVEHRWEVMMILCFVSIWTITRNGLVLRWTLIIRKKSETVSIFWEVGRRQGFPFFVWGFCKSWSESGPECGQVRNSYHSYLWPWETIVILIKNNSDD